MKAFWLSMAALYYRRLPAVLVAKTGVDETTAGVVVLPIPIAFAVLGIALTLGNLDVLLAGGGP